MSEEKNVEDREWTAAGNMALNRVYGTRTAADFNEFRLALAIWSEWLREDFERRASRRGA